MARPDLDDSPESILQRLRTSEARYRMLVEQASDAIIVTDREGRIQTLNAAGIEMLGYPPGRLPNLSVLDLIHRDDLAANPPDREGFASGRALMSRRRLLRRDGSTFLAETSTRRLEDGGAHIIVRDITERVRREEELERESARLQLLKDIAVAANQSADVERTFEVSLERVCTTAGWVIGHVYTRAETERDLLVPSPIWHPAEAQSCARFREATMQTPFRAGEGVPGRVFQTRAPEWIEDIAARPEFVRRESALAAGLRCACAFPVLVGDEVVAVLEFFADAPRPVDAQLQDVMSHAGTQLGRAWERRRADQILHEMTSRMNLALQSARMGTWSWDLQSNAVAWDDYIFPLFGLERGPGPGGPSGFASLVHPEDRRHVELEIERSLRSAGVFEFEFRVTWPDGSVHALMSRGQVHRDAEGWPARVTGVCWDVTERRGAEEQIRKLAYFDSLTGLANRRLFQERLSGAVERASKQGRTTALLFLDLDDFKDVNDTLGHSAGDILLQQVARRLLSTVRLRDFVARSSRIEAPAAVSRLGGDEFTLLLSDVAAPEDAAKVAMRVLQSLSQPFDVAGNEVYARASIGIAVSPADGEDAATLLRNADTAMYHAKRRDRGGYMFYARSMNEAAARKRRIEALLRHALQTETFVLHYQPIVEARGRRVVGAEALLRLDDPQGRPVSPAEAIAVAEESGLISPLGDWILRNACLQARRWRREGLGGLRLAVNVSGHQLRQADFAPRVAAVLREAGVRADRVVLEITESAIMQDDAVTSRSLRELHEMGLLLALDDFGTGYSSLSYLRRFPLQRLKIDRSFVSEVATNPNDAALTAAILHMAHSLGLRTVAEGVERREHVDFLLAHGCEELQGYLFSRPLPPDDFLAHARKQGVWEEEAE